MRRKDSRQEPGWSQSTQQRLLEIAGEVFASRGFEGATVAEITSKAGVNVASINYHFRGKLGLYVAVLRQSLPPPTLGSSNKKISPAAQLTAFITEFVHALLHGGRPSWQTRLMAREIAQPTPALREVIRKIILPNHTRLRGILSAHLGLPAESEPVRLSAQSIIAQCVHWAHCQPVLAHIWPELRMDEEQVERIAAHVAKFSIAGLKAMRPAPSGKGTKKRNR